MLMTEEDENFLNWGQSPSFYAEVDAGTSNCIKEHLQSQGRFECAQVLQNAGNFSWLFAKQAPEIFPNPCD